MKLKHVIFLDSIQPIVQNLNMRTKKLQTNDRNQDNFISQKFDVDERSVTNKRRRCHVSLTVDSERAYGGDHI